MASKNETAYNVKFTIAQNLAQIENACTIFLNTYEIDQKALSEYGNLVDYILNYNNVLKTKTIQQLSGEFFSLKNTVDKFMSQSLTSKTKTSSISQFVKELLDSSEEIKNQIFITVFEETRNLNVNDAASVAKFLETHNDLSCFLRSVSPFEGQLSGTDVDQSIYALKQMI